MKVSTAKITVTDPPNLLSAKAIEANMTPPN